MENIKFRLQKIETRQFAILPEAYTPKAEKFKFSFAINFNFPLPEERIVCTSCLIKYEGKVSPFLVLETAIYFEVEQNSWNSLIDKNSNQIYLPKTTAHHMMSLLVGAARGILHSETKNTEFNRLVLPTINLSKIINDDVIQSLSEPEETPKE